MAQLLCISFSSFNCIIVVVGVRAKECLTISWLGAFTVAPTSSARLVGWSTRLAKIVPVATKIGGNFFCLDHTLIQFGRESFKFRLRLIRLLFESERLEFIGSRLLRLLIKSDFYPLVWVSLVHRRLVTMGSQVSLVYLSPALMLIVLSILILFDLGCQELVRHGVVHYL